ncbi:MAG: hypothetical protein ACOCP5_04010 [Halanaerobiaceae bacterium]
MINEEEIKITTNFNHFSDVPPKLKKIFKLEKNKNKSWINLDTGAFIPFALSANFNPRPLLIVGCSIIGGGIGSIINIYGTLIGALAGLITAFIALAFNKNKNYEVKVKVNKDSNLIIIARPE